jgi:phosphoglycolate phosphatase
VIAAIIFDCDGVLFDSWRANVAFYNAVLARAGHAPLDAEWELRAHVMASVQLFEAMFAGEPKTLAHVVETMTDTDYDPFYAMMEPVDRLHETLAELKRSYRLGMASNRGKTMAGVVRRFELDRYIDAAVGVLDVEHPKPHPAMVAECAARLGVEPRHSLFVGDAPSDLAAAEAAGSRFVAIGDGAWSTERIARLEDLPRYVAKRSDR